jgi:hypothetical protein
VRAGSGVMLEQPERVTREAATSVTHSHFRYRAPLLLAEVARRRGVSLLRIAKILAQVEGK